MSSINFSEILTIAIIVLVVFGPNRLPDLARKAGNFIAKARMMVRDTEAELRSQYGESFQAIDDARKEIGAARRDITSTARRAERELRAAAADIERGVNREKSPGDEAAVEEAAAALDAAEQASTPAADVDDPPAQPPELILFEGGHDEPQQSAEPPPDDAEEEQGETA